MASTEISQQMRHGAETGHADFGTGAQANGELKGLLNAIVDQISEADRRHSETLQQMHERITGISRETKAIKPRVPDHFAAAFEQIETGMAEIASRITSTNADAPQYSANHVSPVTRKPVSHTNGSNSFADAPKALRSASDGSVVAATRMHTGVDTFDVIESSPPAGVTDPWDREQAEALAGVYESTGPALPSKPFAPSATAPAAAIVAADALPSAVDHGWLEARFTEISKRIEDSLHDLNPDQSFFALGQRVDQLEQHFSTLFEGVATHSDVEGVRLIEAHVNELAEHLEHAHTQLMRLDAIESHLAGIAGQLDDVHRAALASGDIPAGGLDGSSSHFAPVDMHSVARTAAEAAAQEFAKFQPRDVGSETAEIGAMLRAFIADSRQGEENTTALLDTLQQAMIRLLDRVDAMELSNLKSAQAHAMTQAEPAFAHAPQQAREDYAGHTQYPSDERGSYRAAENDMSASLEAVAAAVATARRTRVTDSGDAAAPVVAAAVAEGAPQRPTERIRQDFVAEARRAKMRLAEEAVAVTEAPAAAAPAKPVAQSARGAAKASATPGSKKQASVGGAQRIKVMALSAMLAFGGLWLAKESGLFSGAAVVATTPQAVTGNDVSKSSETPATATPADAPAGALMPSTGAPGEAAPQGDAGDLKLPDGTRGEIMSDDIIVGSASVPMYGVTVDATKPMTADDLARARRQQAMANVSGQLGEAAQRQTRGAAAPAAAVNAVPAALDLNALPDTGEMDDQGRTSIAKSGMSQSSALDLPPATVGPLSLRLAAANGDPSAEFEVGARLAEGKGTEQTFKDAAKWYQRSASKGFAQAQYRIGTLYERGLGLKPDVERAKEWYTRAAEQGNVKAMHNLAVLSANQANATPDYVTAAQWFQKAADFGLADSQFNLAVLKENGLGVEEDLVAAYKWLSLSAKSGDKEAVRRRDILKGKLTTAQLADADQQIATFKVKRSDPEINDARKAGEAWKKNPDNGVNG